MSRFLNADEARASAEARHRRYIGPYACHLCGARPCSCGREIVWEPDKEDWPTFWARFMRLAEGLPARAERGTT